MSDEIIHLQNIYRQIADLRKEVASTNLTMLAIVLKFESLIAEVREFRNEVREGLEK